MNSERDLLLHLAILAAKQEEISLRMASCAAKLNDYVNRNMEKINLSMDKENDQSEEISN